MNAKVICVSCGSEHIVTWKQACEEGCPTCGSHKKEIYGDVEEDEEKK